MAINFPNSPTHGNTYIYQEITYTFIQPDIAFDGYWAVVNPSALSAATSTEINEGTTNDKFNTPLGLQGSKYVREDEATGETVLNHGGVGRMKTTAQGVEVTGQLNLGGTNIAAHIIEEGSDPALGWWRKWSSGLIEQWGWVPNPTLGGNQVSEMPIAFSDINSVIVTGNPCGVSTPSANSYAVINIDTLTDNPKQVTYSIVGFSTVARFNWHAIGY